jgi:hypothetical protein
LIASQSEPRSRAATFFPSAAPHPDIGGPISAQPSLCRHHRGIVRLHSGPAPRLFSHTYLTPAREQRTTVRMSDIQQYLLDYDKNKKEASATAQASATRELSREEGRNWKWVLMGDRAAESRIEAFELGAGVGGISG